MRAACRNSHLMLELCAVQSVRGSDEALSCMHMKVLATFAPLSVILELLYAAVILTWWMKRAGPLPFARHMQ